MAWSDLPAQPNIVLIITDQMRQPQHWPAGFVEKNLKSLHRLMQNGMTFQNAFAAACECSPSRATFVTSTYDNVNTVETTPPNNTLPTTLTNLATMLPERYTAVWKGKWHLFDPADAGGTSLSAYGFQGWDPPDAGTTLGNDGTLGGGGPDNDGRYVEGADGAVEFLKGYTSSDPFFLVVSLVNPHDVHVWVEDYSGPPASYPQQIPDMGVDLPPNRHDTLDGKPQVQKAFRQKFDQDYPFDPSAGVDERGYVNFYAWLTHLVDGRVGRVLDALDHYGFTDRTLVVRFGDHGEMGMSHGMREKMYNAYEEAIHVPLVFSNPLAFPEPQTTTSLASLIDLLPTLATVAGAPVPTTAVGADLSPVLADPTAAVRDAALYAYDDRFNVDDTQVPTHIRALRTEGWLYAVYFSDENPSLPLEFEMYDLAADAGELTNLLAPAAADTGVLPTWRELHRGLTRMAHAARTLPAHVPWPDDVDLSLLGAIQPLERTEDAFAETYSTMK
jgi:choline-sulfatase